LSARRRIHYDLAVATESHPARESRQPLDRDVYCPACDCNLRGLSGNPVRCPACGQHASVGIPDEAALRQLRRATESAKWFAGACILGLLLVACGMYCVQYGALGSAALGAAGVVTGTAGAYAFRRTCLGRRGWFRALVWHVTWSLAGAGLALLAIGALTVLVLLLLDRVWNSKAADDLGAPSWAWPWPRSRTRRTFSAGLPSARCAGYCCVAGRLSRLGKGMGSGVFFG
jgi:hypothetical protein